MGWTIGNALKEGFRLFKAHWALWMGVSLFTILMPMVPEVFGDSVPKDALFIRLLLIAVWVVFSVLVDMGFNTLILKAVRQEEYTFTDFFSRFHLFPSYFIAHILNGLAVLVGLLLLIIPGIWIAIKFSFYRFMVLDRNAKGVESLKMSSALAEGSKWRIFGFMLAAVLINIVGVLLLGIGFLISMPWVGLAWAHIYLTLTQQKAVA